VWDNLLRQTLNLLDLTTIQLLKERPGFRDFVSDGLLDVFPCAKQICNQCCSEDHNDGT
jgi:hypothetical protein